MRSARSILVRTLTAAAAVLALAAASSAAPLPAQPAPDAAGAVRAPSPRAAATPLAAQRSKSSGSGFAWTDAPIDVAGDVGAMLSVVGSGASSVPHVVYYDATNNGGNLKYATLNASGTWVTATLAGTVNDEGNVTSITVDGGSREHIIHYDQTTSTWRHVWRAFDFWSSRTIENLGVPGVFGMDSGIGYGNNRIFAAYPNVGGTGLHFATCTADDDPGPWVITSHDLGLTLWDIDLVGRPNGDAHLAYIDFGNGDLRYAIRDAGGGFTSQVAQPDVQCGGCTVAIAVDSQERPHIVYPRSNAGVPAATHTWLDGGTWFAEDLETGTVFNDLASFSLQIDPFDNLHVAYSNNVTQQLRYAKKVGGSWSFEDVTPMTSTGQGVQHVGLYLKGSCPSIVHYDPISGDLEFASPAGGSTHLVPGDYGTIREALAFACDGDVVRVAAGTYVETGELDFDGKELDLVSDDGPEATVIQLSGEDLVRLDQTEGFGGPVRLEGFTIEGGWGVRSDGNGDATITNCIVRATDGTTSSAGKALHAIETDLTVSDCRFSGNYGSGDGPIRVITSQVDMVGCTVAGNDHPTTGGLNVSNGSVVNLDRCIVWGNCGANSSTEEILIQTLSTLNATDCVIDASGVGGPGTINYISGNVFTDPLFCGPILCPGAPTTAGDYTLNLDSPALAANHPSGQLVGALGLGCGLLFDVDGFTSPADETQAGYLRLTDPAMGGNGSNGAYNATGTYGGITATAAASNGWRDRGIPPNQQMVPQVLRDFVYSEGTEGSQIVVTISGLPAGAYEATSYHHDWFVWANAHPFDILVDDAAGAGRLVANNADYTSAPDYPGETYLVVSNGAGDVVIRIAEDSPANSVRFNGLMLVATDVTSVEGPVVDSPRRFDLMAAAPNPFRDRTSVDFAMPRDGLVRLDVYDVSGRRVRSLLDRSLDAGAHRAEWDGRFDSGASAGAGIYFFRLDTGDYQETRKVVFIK